MFWHFPRRALDEDIEEILRLLHILLEKDKRIMSTIADLDAEIKGELTDATNAIIAKVTELEAAASPDTAPQIAELKALAANLNNTLNPPAPTPPA